MIVNNTEHDDDDREATNGLATNHSIPFHPNPSPMPSKEQSDNCNRKNRFKLNLTSQLGLAWTREALF